MYKLAQGGFTSEEVARLLRQSRTVTYGFDILDKNEVTIGAAHSSDCKIFNNIDASIQRSASLTLVESGDIDFASDRLRPYMMLHTDKGMLTYPLGLFLMSSPTRRPSGGSIQRMVECYDKTQILEDDKFTERYVVQKQTAYTAAVAAIIASAGITQTDIEHSSSETETDIEFSIGTSKLSACNALLDAINYYPVYADSYGRIAVKPYILPYNRSIDAVFDTGELSITASGAQEDMDMFNVPNKIVRYLENAERGYLISSIQDDNPESKLSTVSRGRTIVDIAAVSDVADQGALDTMVARLLAERQIYQTLSFETLNMPNHEYADCLYIDNKEINVSGKFIETAWQMDLSVGGRMRHTCRKAVNV